MKKNKRGFTPLEKSNTERNSLTGFTLVEILISLLVLGIGITIMFNLFPLAFQSLMYSRRLNEAYFLAEKKLEELKSQGLSGQTSLSGREGELSWKISSGPLKLSEGVEVINAEVDIDFIFQGKLQAQKFVTYLSGE